MGMWSYETFTWTHLNSTTLDGPVVLHGWLNMSRRQRGQHPLVSIVIMPVCLHKALLKRSDVKAGQYMRRDSKIDLDLHQQRYREKVG